MYFPYFRGRQYELLALNELAMKKLISNKILPIVEPIKISATLKNMIRIYQDGNLCISLVFNPGVGELCGMVDEIKVLCDTCNRTQLIPSFIMNEDASSYLSNMTENYRNEILILLTDRDFIVDYEGLFGNEPSLYTLIPDDRQFRRSVTHNKILFENKFNKKPKNSEYPDDEFFSDDHLYYADEGYSGFGDYSIVGSEYSESGFAPYAVAIHIVYFAKDNTLRLRHFLSDSNLDTSDVAGKFYEAITKLNSWVASRSFLPWQRTEGLNILLNHYNNKTYPGLPTLKKLSIMHHLELVNKYLNGNFSYE